jgi:ATP-binding cassette subfamily B protein
VSEAGADKPKRPLRQRAVVAWRGLAPFARPHRGALVPGILGALGVVAARLAFPWPLRGVLELTIHDGGERGAEVTKLVPAGGNATTWLISAFVVIIAVWALAEYVQRLAFARFASGTVRDARDAAIKRLEARGGESSKGPGEMLARIMGDSQRLKSGIRSVLVNTTRNGFFFLGVAAIILIIDLAMGLVFVAGGVVSVLVACVGAHKAARMTRRFRRRESALTGRLHRMLASAGDREDPEAPEEPATDKPAGRPASSKLSRVEGATTIAIHAVLAVSTCVILVLAIRAGQAGTVSPGAIFIVLIYVTLMHNKMVSFGRMVVRLGRVVTSAERLAGVSSSKRRREGTNGAAKESNLPARSAAPPPVLKTGRATGPGPLQVLRHGDLPGRSGDDRADDAAGHVRGPRGRDGHE